MTAAVPARHRPRALPARTLARLTPADCTPTQWATAKAKADAGNRVLTFIENGMHSADFTKSLYRTCSQHLFSHIALHDQHGFADVWFTTPTDKASFIRHAMNARCLGDPAWTWSDVEQHLQDTLADHPALQQPSAWSMSQSSTTPGCAAMPTEPNDATETVVTEVTATLLIGDSTTVCSNCKKPTLLYGVSRHTDIPGWKPKPGGGCGARFVRTDALDRSQPISAARLKELRPDLPVRGTADTVNS
ncbi:hypothetical protein AB0G48_18300 [Streptomyces rubiginosohelvolus]|uniref:hypothetical protein n=1 Tax=Streptomyces rubiginosohelvolus TaxID=67362 RepID=UPI003406AA5A